MRKLLLILMAVLMTSAITDAAQAAVPEAKAPYAVQISPNMGQLRVRENVQLSTIGPNLHSFVIYLPAQTSVGAGFDVGVQGYSVNSISAKLLLPQDDAADSPRGLLTARLKAAQQEKARLDGLKQSLDARMQLWLSQTRKGEDSGIAQAGDLEKIDTAIGERLPDLYMQLAQLPEKMQEVNQLINFLQNELNALGGARPQLAEVTVTLSGPAPAAGTGVTAEYSYFNYNCGWYPSYTFDADPIKGSIVFKQQANIRQNTGQDWNGVEVSLATKAPDFRLQPGDLRYWALDRYQPNSPQLSRSTSMSEKAMSADMMYEAEESLGQMAPAPAPVSLELGTHREWQLGRMNVSSKNPSSIELERKEWQGDFYYTLRPSVEEFGYLTGKVVLDESIELARGQAIFLVDGRMAGSRNDFRAGGMVIELFFGKDEMVTVESQDLISQRGQERFITKTNTYNWAWKYKVENKRNRAVKVRVEDPLPVARDSAIKITTQSKPKASEDYRTYYWEAEIPAGGEYVIEHSVEARASGSDPIIPGR